MTDFELTQNRINARQREAQALKEAQDPERLLYEADLESFGQIEADIRHRQRNRIRRDQEDQGFDGFPMLKRSAQAVEEKDVALEIDRALAVLRLYKNNLSGRQIAELKLLTL